MRLSKEITKQLLDKAGLTLSTPSVGNRLSEIIWEKTGERLGVNTVKRLLGIYNDNGNPRRFTLEVVAHFLGYENYEELVRLSENNNSGFLKNAPGDIVSAKLKPGTIVTITYRPDRMLMLRHEEADLFIVVRSENSKLHKGDLCNVVHLKSGMPFYATDVKRNGKNLGNYIAGEDGGIKIVEVI